FDHGIHLSYGKGNPEMDPLGRLHTIDPDANVLRVDRRIGKRYVPVGMWSTFANHGTVNKFQFDVFNEDHHGAAIRLSEQAMRRDGRVPAGQDVVTAYGNSDEGDMSSGLVRSGPAAAEWVGEQEANAFLYAWRQAGRHMQSSPAMDRRWTRMCFCGQDTPAGPVADKGAFGMAEFTGSEEGRGPLFDITRQPFEGDALPIGGSHVPVVSDTTGVGGPQGDKSQAPIPLDIPKAVPLMTLRIGDRMIASIPGEMTEDMGRRVRAAVTDAARGSGVTATVISGLANEYADYFTTPEEYDAQHYEGAATVYGRASSVALEQVLVQLAGAMAGGKPAPAAYPFDPENGVNADAQPFSSGAASGSPQAQPPASAPRLSHPSFAWHGGERGYDRPVGSPFVLVQRLVTVRVATRPKKGKRHRRVKRRTVRRWQTVDSDLGLNILWTVDKDGLYRAEWEVPLDAPTGSYRFVIQANHYKLTSSTFQVIPSHSLTLTRVPNGVQLHYPPAQQHELVGDPPGDVSADLTYRPDTATTGRGAFLVNGNPRTAYARPDGVFQVPAPAGSQVVISPGSVQDRWGNANGDGLNFNP
ncbi:MAG: neutral/alkaline non-lysosomal ceramidase N-terminal domain-containing protein, partial [Gaiellaceae bacterium]